MEETWTILRVLQWTTGYFNKKGIDQPRANAEVLLAHILGKERIELYLQYDQPLTTEELASYREAVRRRAAREPTQYITRKQEFWSLEFEVSPSVLIPRPETELLIEKLPQLLKSCEQQRVLDLGTGSGAIAVAVARECATAQIVATDLSYDALQLAKRNASRHNVSHRIRFAAMDLFSGFSSEHALFDVIISNPPYIGEEEFSRLAPEVAEHEPGLALRGGGAEGLDVIRHIINQAHAYLAPGGTLLMEMGQGQSHILKDELAGSPHYDDFRFIQDYSGIPRVIQLRKIKR